MSQKQGKKPRPAGSSGPGTTFYLILVGVVVIGAAALLFARGGDSGPIELPPGIMETEANAAAGIVAGPADAPVTLVEFADFQCPACARFYAFAGRLIKQNYVDNGGQVRWVFYDYPLDQHPHAVPAALAARCAEEQGGFWQMHDLIFARQNDWSPKSNPRGDFEDYAREIGLDGSAFDACMEEGRYLSDIFAAARYGQTLGVNSTPTLFVNGRRARSDYESLEQMIQEAVASSAQTGAAEGATEQAAGGE